MAFRLWLFAFAFKLLLLGIFVFPQGQSFVDRYDPGKQKQQYDDREYYQLGKRLAEYGTCGVHFGDPHYRSAFRTPGYSVLIAIMGTICGWNPLAMLVLQGALLSLIPVLLLVVLKDLKLPCWPAWVLACEPLLNVVSVTFMTEGLFCLCVLLAFWCFLRARNLRYRFLAYPILALSVLVKPSVQYLYVLSIIAGFILIPRRAATMAAVVLSLVPLTLWVLRNHDVTGKYLLSTQTDNMVLAVPVMESVRTGVSKDEVIKRIVRENSDRYDPMFLEYGNGSLSGLLRDNKFDFKEYTTTYIKEHPMLFVRCHVGGMLQLMFGTMEEHVRQVFFNGRKIPPFIHMAYTGYVMVFYCLLYAFIVGGFRWLDLKEPAYVISAMFACYNILLIGVFAYLTGGGLKRVPFIPFLFVMAAYASVVWAQRLSKVRERSGATHGNA